MAKKTPEPMELFYSYAHEDEKYCGILEKWLTLLMREKIISTWYDRKINAGNEWAHEIDKHLNTAQIILLLASPDFIASDYCYLIEMKKALRRHKRGEARVIPVILRPVELKHTPFGKIQALPSNGKPITNWPSRDDNFDDAFHDVAEGIRKAVEELTQLNTQTRFSDAMKMLEILVSYGPKGVDLRELKKMLGLSSSAFDEAEAYLVGLDYVRCSPISRHVTEAGTKFWREQQA